MSGYQVLARTYRPGTFTEVVGQEAVARTLTNAIKSGRVAHAYMFCGPRGVGKTSMARILARALNCLSHDAPTTEPCGECDLCVAAARGDDLDVFEMDAASHRKVDDARNLIGNVSFHPARTRFKVYIVDEVHMLTTEAFNALLKTLEEPPPHVKFIFATTDPQKVPATILSRCQRFDFRPVPAASIAETLARIAESEGMTADDQALVAISRAAAGGLRDALSLLEQLATLGGGGSGGGDVRLEDLHALLGTVSAELMIGLWSAVASGDVATALERTSALLDAGTDPGELLRQAMRHAHDLLLVKVQGPQAAGVVADRVARQALSEQAAQFSDATLAYAVTLLSEALKNVRLLGEGRLFAETALARLAGHGDMRYVDQLLRDVKKLEARLSALPQSAAAPQRPAVPQRPAGPQKPAQARPAPAAHAAPVAVSEAVAPAAVPAVPAVPSGPRGPTGPPPSAAVPPEPAVVSGGIALETLAASWANVREVARGFSSRLGAALEPARVEDVAGGALTLSFPPSAGFHRGALGDADLAERLADAVEQVVGERLRVRTTERPDAPEPDADAGAAPRRPPSAMREKLSSAEIDTVHQAPLTKMIESELGGRILHVERDS